MSDILAKLGLDEETFEWQDLSLCSGIDIHRNPDGSVYDPMFDTYESDSVVAKTIDEMCLRCPVLKQCFADGIEGKQDGVRGGIYLVSGTVDQNKNKHKTPEVWEAIAKRVAEVD